MLAAPVQSTRDRTGWAGQHPTHHVHVAVVVRSVVTIFGSNDDDRTSFGQERFDRQRELYQERENRGRSHRVHQASMIAVIIVLDFLGRTSAGLGGSWLVLPAVPFHK